MLTFYEKCVIITSQRGDTMTNMTREQWNKMIEEERKTGKYPTVTLDVLEKVKNLKVSDDVLEHVSDTTKCLKESYLDVITEFKHTNPGLKEYLNAIKAADIIDNQKMEKENSFLIGLYMQTKKEAAIDKLIKKLKTKGIITGKDIVNIHDTLLFGTSSENDERVRSHNYKFVGRKFQSGKVEIDYFVLDYKDIPAATKGLADVYNNPLGNEKIDSNIFIRPFVVHGLLGALQVFEDGNTRMGRIMQHTLMWQLINEQMEYDFEQPPIYATRSYYPMREKCREKIKNIVVQNDDDAWNDWFHFNLDRIEDQMYCNDENIKSLKRRIK